METIDANKLQETTKKKQYFQRCFSMDGWMDEKLKN